MLTSEEVGAGLRRLRGCPMLALDRFKSIQKRGLIEPRRRNPPKAPGRVVGGGAALACTKGSVAAADVLRAHGCSLLQHVVSPCACCPPLTRSPARKPTQVEYEKQARRERAVEGQAELAELVQANKKSRAALKLRS